MRSGALLAALAGSTAACGARLRPDAGPARDADFSCPALRVVPANVRVATGRAVHLHAEGGSGSALFGIEGDAQGATIEPGGGLRAGSRAATFMVVARDDVCDAEARAQVEVIGPFDVQPRMTRVAAGGTVRFTATGNVGDVVYALLARPAGAGTMGSVSTDGVFTAGSATGSYDLVATDSGSGLQVRLVVDVGSGVPLRPRASIVALPVGERVPLEWRGGSGVFDATVTGPAGGRVVSEGNALLFDASAASPGYADVAVTDRYTRERASVRVLVGDVLGTTPIARGTQTALGDMAAGDVNGDGRADLIVGHAERSALGLEAGGVLVFHASAAGSFGERPDTVIEGERERDRFGSVLLVSDVNDDGFDDVIVGAPERDLGESNRGAVSLFLGSAGGLHTTPERVFVGEDRDHRFGSALALRDLTGDGAPELVVGAPGAVNPFARTCLGGRVYIYRANPEVRGVFEAVPWQIVDVRDPLSDDVEAPLPCSSSGIGGGRSLALIDMDNDRQSDLVVGAPEASFGGISRHGAVVVYRGTVGGRFEPEPTWSIHLQPSERTTDANFGLALDVVSEGTMGAPEVLVVRSAGFDAPNPMMMGARFGNSGGLWVFAPGSLGPPAPDATNDAGMPVHRVRVLTTLQARATYFGAASNRGVGRAAALADLDGDGRFEYVVGSAASGAPGSVQVFSASAIVSGSGTLLPLLELTHMGNELQGFRVAGLRGASGPWGLASWAAWRSTAQGIYVGAVDYVPPAAGPIAMRWSARATIALPGFGASDRAGTAVALGELASGAMHAVVGAPGAHSPALPMAMPPRPAGDRLRTGAVDVYPPDATATFARAWVDRTDAQVGGGPLALLDFDGDGALDLAVGDPGESAGGAPPMGFVSATPNECVTLNAMGMPVNTSSRGVVRIYSLAGGSLVERFRLVSARESARSSSPTYLRNRFGAALAVADVNGDGRDDLVVGRTNGADSNGAEVVLGRAPDPMGRVLIACNTGTTGAMGASVFAPYEPGATTGYGTQVAGIGDLDRDGCDEVAVNIVRASGASSSITRAGVVVAFGYGSGTQCMGHNAPFMVRVVPDDRWLDNNIPGDAASRVDDEADLQGLATGAGSVLARGAGDVTGDGVPDLVFRDTDLPFGALRGPAVEIISGAYIAGLCPNRVCPNGRTGSFWADGEWRVLALRTLPFPHRRVVPSAGLASRFGSAIALADLTGDGAAELAIGSADDSFGAPFAGVVRVFRGGATSTTQEALLGDPWLLAVGDLEEVSSFGASVAIARSSAAGAWLLAGAPTSNREGRGGNAGAAYRWRVEVPR